MSKSSIRIVDNTATPWMSASTESDDLIDDAVEPFEVADSDPCSAARFYHPGSETDLQMFEVRVPPDERIDQHAHLHDEIIYVLSGEMHLGSQRLKPGMSAYIRGDTLYGFRAGPEGLRFLNFRAAKDLSYFSKDAYMARRAQARTSS